MNATVLQTETNGMINTSVTYSEHSTASGALFSFVYIAESGRVNFNRSFLLALDKNTSNNTLPFNLYPGHYQVYTYDIEHDGTLSNGAGYPADQLCIDVSRSGSYEQGIVSEKRAHVCNKQALFTGASQIPINCTVSSSSSLISVECTWSCSNCSLVTGFQVIAQLGEASEVHTLHVNQSTDLQTPVTISAERDGEYWVSIFAISGENGIMEWTFVQYIQTVGMIIGPTSGTMSSTTDTPTTQGVNHKLKEFISLFSVHI
jgi:hypothetical protein